MAPRRGGGSSSGGLRVGSSSSSCPGAFNRVDSVEIPYFVAFCLFFLVNVVIAGKAAKTRKKHPHVKATKLISWLYGLSVFFYILGYALIIIATMLRECGTTGSGTYNNLAVAFRICFRFAQYLLLVLVLAGVNSCLRKTVGNNPAFLKIVYAVIATFMFILLVAYLGLDSYYIISINTGDYTLSLARSSAKLGLAYYVFYMLVVLLAGAGGILSIVQLRSARKVTGHLTLWVPMLYFSMLIYIVFSVALMALALDLTASFSIEASEAFEYITDFFQAMALISVISIAKDTALTSHPLGVTQPVYSNNTAYQNNTAYPPQQPAHQYAYNNQSYGYGQPVHQIAGTPVSGTVR